MLYSMFLGLTIVCENWISNRERNMKSFRIESNNISGTKFLEKFTFLSTKSIQEILHRPIQSWKTSPLQFQPRTDWLTESFIGVTSTTGVHVYISGLTVDLENCFFSLIKPISEIPKKVYWKKIKWNWTLNGNFYLD